MPHPIQIQSPYDVRPPDAVDFYRRGYDVGRTPATTPSVLPGSVKEVPTGKVAVIRSLTLVVNNLLLTSDIVWRLRFNGSPVDGWNELQVIPGAVAYYAFTWGPAETFVPTPDAATIDIQVEVRDAGGNYEIGAAYHGWEFSKELAERAREAYR
jgi:hypothetical protein